MFAYSWFYFKNMLVASSIAFVLIAAFSAVGLKAVGRSFGRWKLLALLLRRCLLFELVTKKLN